MSNGRLQPEFHGVHDEHIVRPKTLWRDTRSMPTQLWDGLKSRTGTMAGLFICAIVPFFFQEWTYASAVCGWIIYRLRISSSKFDALPFRLPSASGRIDYNDPKPGRTGFSKAQGVFMLGNTFGDTKSELWLSRRDMLTHMLAFGTTGSGKAQPLDAKIMLPDDKWTTMGNLKPGDRIAAGDGTNTLSRVLAVFPQGYKQMYLITLSDGSSTECCKEHLWRCDAQKDKESKSGIYPLSEVMEFMDAGFCCSFPRLMPSDSDTRIDRRFIPVLSVLPSSIKLAQCILVSHPSHLYVTDNGIVTHNTEFLVSMAFNALAMGSGMFYVDPKASPKLTAQIYTMCRVCGRDDDFRLINFMPRATTKKTPIRTTNTTNPFTYGNAESLSEILIALIPPSEGSNAIFSQKGMSLMRALMRVLVELRDRGEIQLSVRTIRNYISLGKVMELAERDDFIPTNIQSLRAFMESVGWQRGKELDKQPRSLAEQFSYAQSYFNQPLNSLTDTYGHIYDVDNGEVDMMDVVLNRRILVIPIPSLKMSVEELKNLGKICLSSIRMAIAVGLGQGKEGAFADILDALPTDAPAPFISITDEYAAIPAPGYVEVLTQGRGLGIAAIVASQDYAGITKADKEGAEQLLANSKIKISLKLTVADATWDMLSKLAGKVDVMETSGSQVKPEQGGISKDYLDTLSANVKERDRIRLEDLSRQIEGEFHAFFEDRIVRGQAFFANPPLPGKMQLRVPQLLQSRPMDMALIKHKHGKAAALTDRLVRAMGQLADGQSLADVESALAEKYAAACPKAILAAAGAWGGVQPKMGLNEITVGVLGYIRDALKEESDGDAEVVEQAVQPSLASLSVRKPDLRKPGTGSSGVTAFMPTDDNDDMDDPFGGIGIIDSGTDEPFHDHDFDDDSGEHAALLDNDKLREMAEQGGNALGMSPGDAAIDAARIGAAAISINPPEYPHKPLPEPNEAFNVQVANALANIIRKAEDKARGGK